MLINWPGSPEPEKICRPVTFPCNPSNTLGDGLLSRSFALTFTTEAVVLDILRADP
ncbi:Uncharacterised protein [Chlamydia trachomatis]|nr:Uncharacterised protein [Chlamydia trachomatis]